MRSGRPAALAPALGQLLAYLVRRLFLGPLIPGHLIGHERVVLPFLPEGVSLESVQFNEEGPVRPEEDPESPVSSAPRDAS